MDENMLSVQIAKLLCAVNDNGYDYPADIQLEITCEYQREFHFKIFCIVHKKDGTPVSFSKSASYSVPVPAS